MNREDRKHAHHMRELGRHEIEKSRKKASKLRTAMVKKGSRRGRFDQKRWEDEYETAPGFEKRRRLPSLDELLVPVAAREDSVDESLLVEGTLVSVTRRFCTVLSGGALSECYLPARLAAVQQSEIAAGDRVRWWLKEDGNRMIHSILPRRTFLARPDPHVAHLQRVIAANVDVVVNVVSVKSPPLRPRLIDRYLIATMQGGATPLVCVNKVDLLSEEDLREELECLDAYRDLGVETVLCSTRDGRGLDELGERLRGGTSVFVGHSGVGKSSILKKLIASAGAGAIAIDADAIRVGEVSQAWGTGIHTTRLATLYDLGGGTSIIDTPGVREFGLWNLNAETLAAYFPELDQYAGACRFNDCSHSHEPDCAVRDAADAGEISGARFDTYLRLMDELKEQGSGR